MQTTWYLDCELTVLYIRGRDKLSAPTTF